ncbi:MAG: sigma-70 family RNA polymerase sigma factor [Dorea sp.]|nr:sigma-70 family RNA polymerase sigma factor [Dorea sp.]
MNRFIPKEVSALKEIEKAYTQHAKDVYRFLLSLTHDEDLAEELTQETFFRAMRTIDRYDGSCKLSVWLCQIARHLWYQYLGKRSRRNETELTDEVPCQESPEQSVMLHMDKTQLYQAIHRLPEPMRELVHLRLTGEFSFAEIGSLLGKSENWARTAFYRAKQKIIKEMEGRL